MLRYIFKRFLIAIPLLIAISFITFLFINLAPGNYFDRLRLNPQISEQTIEKYQKLYHLDKPLIIQFGSWLLRLCHFDLGYSFTYNVPVTRIIKSRLFNTLLLAISALLFTWVFAIPLGTIAAVKSNKFLDKIISLVSYTGLSMPTFFLALLLLYLASYLGFLPLGGMISSNFYELSLPSKIFDILKHLIIPTIVISFGAIASLQRVMRGNMLEVLRAQYIMSLKAKGLPEKKIIYKHALRNAINPLITIFGYQLSGLLSGAALTEIICNWPGLGSLMLYAVRSQDLFLVMGSMLVGGIMLILGNLIADILLALSDPRIRMK
jgi:peptide/nickel transport system permease protein